MTAGAVARSRAPAASPRRRVAVLAAMPAELAALARRARPLERLRIRGCRVHRGRLGSSEVWLAATGDGAPRAARGSAALLEHLPADLVVVVGVSAGLAPSLAEGALVVAREIRSGAAPLPRPDPAWVRLASSLPGTVEGTVVVTEAILAGRAAKREAWRALDGVPAVADLESAAFAMSASARGLPFLVVRAVLDTAAEDLPVDLEACRDRSGSVSRPQVLVRALARPRRLAGLLALRGRVETSSRLLAGLVEALLEGGAP